MSALWIKLNRVKGGPVTVNINAALTMEPHGSGTWITFPASSGDTGANGVAVTETVDEIWQKWNGERLRGR